MAAWASTPDWTPTLLCSWTSPLHAPDQERGDAAAAELATNLARVVERTSVRHGGRPIKCLATA